MRLIEKITEMKEFSARIHSEGKVIAFVPTMGYMHEGHLSLMREGRRLGDVLVVSIYVNPSQFGEGEDLSTYPRDLERDLSLSEEVGTDVVFAPEDKEMYPPDYQTFVEVKEVTKGLCGNSRPHFFRGVTTVVLKLFNIIQPDFAIFGEKDYQQLVTVRQMVRDLNMDVSIIGMPLIRDSDGLAVSSRNAYLRPEERKTAYMLYKSLTMARDIVRAGERDCVRILDRIKEALGNEEALKLDYATIVNPEDMNELESIEERGLLALAAWVGETRLIDNIMLEE